MNYFKILSIVWGVIMIGVRLLIHLIPEKWSNFELNKAYSEEKPKWIWGVGIFSIFIVIVTWYKEITTEVHLSIILSILITLTLIKVSQILFNYNKFRSFVTKALVEDRRIITQISIGTTILGIILILLGIFLY
ncbi:MAG: hypothetical protein FH761_15725 [Firmicutes bacterium]|nr:hypothetical protein [Bacillota bacterium]